MGFPCLPPPPHLVSASLCHMERGLVGLCHSASGLPPTLQDGEEPPPPPKPGAGGFLREECTQRRSLGQSWCIFPFLSQEN